jgi:hypothetical protein
LPTLRSIRNRLAGIPGGGLVVALCALMATQGCTSPQPVVVSTPQRTTTTTTTTTTQAAPAPASSAAPEAVAAEQGEVLSSDQLDSLVAPVALYPDPLLAQCLVASTYPLDVVAAQQWLAKNSTLKGDELVKAAEQQSWDPSVQALVSLPDALKLLNENISWTTQLGDAFLAQQEAVMDAVQRLRVKAKDGGKLASTEQQKVETKVVDEKTVVEIQPASTEVVYVPTYSPSVIWGPMMYPYPSMYYPPYYAGGAWLGFGVGIAIGIGISGGWGWGCGWGGNNTININNNNNYVNHHNRQNNVNRSGNSNWQHNAKQRGGAPYKDRATANKYGGGARGDSAQTRQAQARSRQGQGGNRGGSGSRPSTGSFDRGGSGGRSGSGSFDRGGSSSNKVGNRNVSPSRGSSSSAFGGSRSGSHARASSSRGGMSRGGGGGGRRR